MDEAATLLTSVVEARVAELGPEHADSARAKMQLAVLRQQMGSAEEAMALYREVIDARTAELDEAPAALDQYHFSDSSGEGSDLNYSHA